ncbi:MAG: phage tail protein [Ruminococcus sp.]|nr:phage tail protein [Ruminococcus sp.]
MDNIRIAVLDTYNGVLAFLDNDAPGAMHYYDDELHQYLKGTANTYNFKCDSRHEDSVYLAAGNKLAFRYRNKDYYLNIMRVIRDEFEVEVEAYSLSLELLNEWKGPYKSETAMSFVQYMDVLDPSKTVEIGINEVSNKSISNEWTGEETLLSRLFSLANVFDSEIEFVPRLSDNYSLDKIVMNVYRKHADGVQGIGKERNDIVLRYGKDVSGIKKTEDITDLYTAIIPVGRNDRNLRIFTKVELDEKLRIQYATYPGDMRILAVQERDRFPSNVMTGVYRDRYIEKYWSYDTDNVNVLYGQALAELKKNSVPQVKYEVDGYFDTDIGDTVRIEDVEYNPPLYLQARVTEQSRSFTDPSRNQTTFDNFRELQSQIDPSLLAAMNVLIEANKTYTCSILSDNGIVFKNGQGSTTLTASVMDVGKDMTDSLTINWSKDGEHIYTGKSFSILAADIQGKAVFRFEAVDSGETIRGTYEVTVSNVSDGESGTDGVSPTVTVNPDTSLTITDKNGTQTTPILKGDDGAKGDPTGITVSAIEPTTKYTGMLWQHTGTVAGMIKNATYRWTGSAWTLYKFRADNIEATSFMGYEFNGAVFKTSFDFENSGGLRQVGTSKLSNGELVTESVISAGTVSQQATLKLGREGLTIDTNGNVYGKHFASLRDDTIEFDSELSNSKLWENGLAVTSKVGTLSSTVVGQGHILFTDTNGSVNIDRTSFNGKAPNNHASTGTGYGVGTTANYGHVKTRNDVNASSYVAGEALSAYQGYVVNNKITSLCSSVVTKGRVNVTAGSANWLNITAIPSFNTNNRYYAIVNNRTVPLMAFVRDDGRLIAWGPNVYSGTTYTVDYLVFIS